MDKRRLQRTKIRHSGKVLARGEIAHDCTVNNVTGLGLCIEFAFETEGLPETLDFSFDNFRTIHSCKIIWREANIAGVAFEKPLWPSLAVDVSRRAKLKVVK
jgi:hypothetical protein